MRNLMILACLISLTACGKAPGKVPSLLETTTCQFSQAMPAGNNDVVEMTYTQLTYDNGQVLTSCKPFAIGLYMDITCATQQNPEITFNYVTFTGTGESETAGLTPGSFHVDTNATNCTTINN